MYARPTSREEGRFSSFGVSGKLWHGALLMYDRETRSLWSQHANRAIAGPLAGQQLDVMESQVTDWQTWKAAHPATTVVVKPKATGWVADLVDSRLIAAGAFLVAGVMFLIHRRRPLFR